MSDYHSDRSCICNSQLSRLKESPIKYRDEYILGKRGEQTESMLLGSMIHCRVIEYDQFTKRYAIAPPCDRRTTKGKETWAAFVAENPGVEIVSDKLYNRAVAASDSLLEHEDFSALLALFDTGVEIETRIDFDWDGSPSRCKPDIVLPNIHKRICTDIKSTQDASPRGWKKAWQTFGYHRQEAFYREALGQKYGDSEFRFLFAVVETEYPFNSAIHENDLDIVEQGRMELNFLISDLKKRTAMNFWKEWWSIGVNKASMDKWYKTGIYEG